MTAIIAIIILAGFSFKTIALAAELFWPWMIFTIIAALVLAAVVGSIEKVKGQKVAIGLGVAIVLAGMAIWLPLHTVSLVGLALVALVLFAAGALACHDKQMQATGKLAGLGLLFAAPLAMCIYASYFIGTDYALMAGLTAAAGLAIAIWVGSDV